MKGYKAFNKGLICKDKQYKENEVFEEEKAVPCHSGMHFCKNPFDVLNYYNLVDDNGDFSDFAEVEAPEDAEVKTDDNIKYCTTKLKVGAKFSFAGFIKACVDFAIEKTQTEKNDSGDSAQIGSSGDSAQIGSSGNSTQIGSSGNSTQIGSSGNYAKIGSSGDSTQIGSSGNSTQIGSSGDSTQIGSSGDSTQIGSSGNYAKIGSSGDSTQIGSSGDFTQIKSTGYDSIICCAGDDSCVSAKKGSWITLAEWKYSYEKDRYVPKCVKTEYVDGERIKEDTMYKLIDGEFTEV
ncbi:DUF7666 domain-containing protein [Anaerostipes sp. Marseille-Q3525]|uniref:DUF7666 domain-containing protein n=1 Tax=Anaerostipes sp. Marseille-Q3525 TaxID=2758418 RepID=UPI001BAADC84|nr:hypothetical protein [Anaerostipes sp. Marseille-Q3525]MBR9961691.1 hypothetical protein [Anaerostipes sp. Marseille-Q3525]